jgi:type II secretory pathway pseudopilin PulG
MAKAFRRNDGFSLIELGIVMIVSGLLLGAGANMYNSYINDKYAHETYDRMKVIDASLSLFINGEKRLPCPSNPTIPINDPNAGREIPDSSCETLRNPGTAAGTCLDGVCKVAGFRDTEADGDTAVDSILIGGLPFVDIRGSGSTTSVTQQEALDSWNYQFTYAVSAHLTNASTYRASRGTIDVRTEPTTAVPAGVPLVSPEGSSQYVIIGHGDNHRGAYTAKGVINYPCTPGVSYDDENCDGDMTFISGLRFMRAGTTYFDDAAVYNSYSISALWDFVGSSVDIYNRNPGNVGVGTDAPTQQLEVVGDIKATKVVQNELCGMNGLGCFSPDALAAPATGAPASTDLPMKCDASTVPGTMNVVIGVTLSGTPPRPRAVCATVPMLTTTASQCSIAGQYAVGINSDGTILCEAPP